MPVPDAEALAHSMACAASLRKAIRTAGGWISFAEFMDKALYAPGLGYYAAGARKFGQAGDFTTAPEISPLFGQCIARSVAGTVRATQGNVLELGPGTGKLAFDMLLALDALNALPERYLLLEVSADLQQRQRETLSALPALLYARCVWISSLPVDFVGAIVANEVLDVVPVHLVMFKQGQAIERGVGLQNDQLVIKTGVGNNRCGIDSDNCQSSGLVSSLINPNDLYISWGSLQVRLVDKQKTNTQEHHQGDNPPSQYQRVSH